jgi:hypothetical protein
LSKTWKPQNDKQKAKQKLSMMRIKIWTVSVEDGKVLRVDASIKFDALIEKIAHKLGLAVDREKDIKDQFELRLGGSYLLEKTDDIENGDDVHLVRRKKQQQTLKPKEVKNEQEDEHNNNNNMDNDDDSSVEDTTEQVKEERRNNKVNPEVVDLLSDDEDEDDDEGSVEEGSDAWDEEGEDPSWEENTGDDSNSDEGAFHKWLLSTNQKKTIQGTLSARGALV